MFIRSIVAVISSLQTVTGHEAHLFLCLCPPALIEEMRNTKMFSSLIAASNFITHEDRGIPVAGANLPSTDLQYQVISLRAVIES